MNLHLRIWGLVCGAATVAVLAGGWFVGVQPQLAAAAAADDSATQVDAQNMQTQSRIAALAAAAAKQPALEAQNAVLLKAVPTVLKPNTFIRRVTEVAALDGVTVLSVAPSAAQAYAPPAAAASGGTTAPALAKTDSSITGANFTAVPVSVSLSGTADAITQFAHDIQSDERTFAVDGVQFAKSDTGDVTGMVNGYIYTLKR